MYHPFETTTLQARWLHEHDVACPRIGGKRGMTTRSHRVAMHIKHARCTYRGLDLPMSYRNKTYVAFASEDIKYYRLMEAWRDNANIDFSFFDAHDLYKARDTSKPETIKGRLTERMGNAKQFVLLGSHTAKRKGSDGQSFLAHEIKAMLKLNLPVVIANLDGDRRVDRSFIPTPLLDAGYHTMSVSFQPKIIKYALDYYAATYATSTHSGCYYYEASAYTSLGL